MPANGRWDLIRHVKDFKDPPALIGQAQNQFGLWREQKIQNLVVQPFTLLAEIN